MGSVTKTDLLMKPTEVSAISFKNQKQHAYVYIYICMYFFFRMWKLVNAKLVGTYNTHSTSKCSNLETDFVICKLQHFILFKACIDVSFSQLARLALQISKLMAIKCAFRHK